MELIDKHQIFKELQLNQDFIKNVKLFYVFKYGFNEINVIIIKNDDKAYVFGGNSDGVLGVGHRNQVKELILNEELSNKQIIDLKNGFRHTIALTIHREVYCWGSNECGLLGNGTNDVKIHKPELNQYLSDKIVDIYCGQSHSLVLTIDGQIYAWGENKYGQIGNGNNNDVSIPHYVSGLNGEKVKAIACGFSCSMALTEEGTVFSWGLNDCGQLGFKNLIGKDSVNVPKMIKINEVINKISCGFGHSLLLSDYGDIYVFGSNGHGQLGDGKIKEQSETPFKLKIESELIDIASHYRENISMALSNEGTVFIWGLYGKEVIKTPVETQFKSFDEAFTNYFQSTYKTIVIGNKLDVERDLRQHNDSAVAVPLRSEISPLLTPSKNDVTDQTRYEREFKELEMIGSGSFGKVYKAFNLFDEQNYAVKKFDLKGFSDEIKNKSLEELKIMARLQSDHVVQYKNSWIENNEILYIQMELCFSTLKDILLKKRNEFQRNEFAVMSRLKYYISSELFKEILESLNYLHKQIPPIIHRDLKPANILITYGLNGRFVKLADFGLAVVHRFDEQTHTQGLGTIKYVAPEVLSGKNYDMKADIFSLGYITQEIFDVDINSFSSNSISDRVLKEKYLEIYNLLLKMMEQRIAERSDCHQILRDKSLWALDMDEIEYDISQLSPTEQPIEENFSMYFIKTKSRFN